MMTQNLLSFQYKIDQSEQGLTSFAGLPLYVDLARLSGLCTEVATKLCTKRQGWSDLQLVMSFILLNLIGGDCVDDIERLEADPGLRSLMLKLQSHGLSRDQRRQLERRWRKSQSRAFPSSSSMHRYLEQFHDAEQEPCREDKGAFIPASNELLSRLDALNDCLLTHANRQSVQATATIDQDATLVESLKSSAKFCYKGYRAYQPFNSYWHEQGMIIHSEFRDGNVPAGFEQLRLLQTALSKLPAGVEKAMMRSDSAGYQRDVLMYCAEGQDPRFGVIDYAISARVCASFRQAVAELPESAWEVVKKPDGFGGQLDTKQEWAEVCFVPGFLCSKQLKGKYRYLAIRERLCQQPDLLEADAQASNELLMNDTGYKIYGLVTNRALEGNEVINWYRARCGDSEQLNGEQKTGLAGGQLPSNKFGANAAWWQLMILAFNLNQLLKNLCLPEPLKRKKMKGIRLHVICGAGRLVKHARQCYVKISAGAYFDLLQNIRDKLLQLAQSPPVVVSS